MNYLKIAQKPSYVKKIIDALSVKLTNEFGSGFSPVSIRRMRKFYEIYPIWSAVPTELSWSHFHELIRIDRKEEREFYAFWDVSELQKMQIERVPFCMI